MYTFLTIQQQFRYAHFRTYSPSETIPNNLVLDLPLRALNFVKIFHYKAIELKARFPLTTFFYTRFAFNPFLLFLSVMLYFYSSWSHSASSISPRVCDSVSSNKKSIFHRPDYLHSVNCCFIPGP